MSILLTMAKKHRPKRGVLRKQGQDIYFAYTVLATLCLVLGLYILLGNTAPERSNDTPSTNNTDSQLEVESPVGGSTGQQEALNDSLQSSGSGQSALQGSVNSQSAGVGSNQLQPSAGEEAYEAYEHQ